MRAADAGRSLRRQSRATCLCDGRNAAELDYVSSPLGHTRETRSCCGRRSACRPTAIVLTTSLRRYRSAIGKASPSRNCIRATRSASPPANRISGTSSRPVASYKLMSARMRDWYELSRDTVAVAHADRARPHRVSRDCQAGCRAADRYLDQGVVYVFQANQIMRYG